MLDGVIWINLFRVDFKWLFFVLLDVFLLKFSINVLVYMKVKSFYSLDINAFNNTVTDAKVYNSSFIIRFLMKMIYITF